MEVVTHQGSASDPRRGGAVRLQRVASGLAKIPQELPEGALAFSELLWARELDHPISPNEPIQTQ